jgi:hypothetical protein
VSVEFGRRLLLSGAVGPSEIQAALFRHLGSGVPFLRALVEIGGVSERALEEELTRSSVQMLDAVAPSAPLMHELPEGLCGRLLAVPVRRDARSGVVEIAVADPYDPHAAEELAFHLKTEVKVFCARLTAIDQALRSFDEKGRSGAAVAKKAEPAPALPTSGRSPSGPPIPLVKRSARSAEGFVGGRSVALSDDDETIEVLGVRDIVEQMEGDGEITDDLGQPILPLMTSKVPRAPKIPKFGKEAASSKQPEVPPETSRGPFSPKPPVAPFADIAGVLKAFDKARTRDEVIENLIAGMSTVARRVGAFAVKKKGFRGIACNRDFGEAKGFREIEIPTDSPTVLGIATSKGSYLGPLPATPPHEPLLRFLNGSAGDVAVVLVSVAGRPAVVLLADALGDKTIATRRAEELAREASRAFSRILTDAKSERRSGA